MTRKIRLVLGFVGLACLAGGCEDDPMDLDYLNQRDAATDSGAAVPAGSDAGQDAATAADSGSPGLDDAGDGDAGAGDAG
jgi:hypothetical protein